MEDIKLVEKALIDKMAAEYLSDGYTIDREGVLDFLPGFQPDLLVQKGDEVKVIEVKPKTSLSTDPGIFEIATVINSRPGWSFELRLLDEPERMGAPNGARPYEIPAIDRRIAEAEAAAAAGLGDAAFLLAWSACEVAIRILVRAAGVEINRVTWPGHTLGYAAHLGVTTGEDDDFLTNMLTYRNALSHGFEVDGPSEERLEDLITAAKRLRQAASSPEGYYDASDDPPHLLGPLVYRYNL